MTLEYQRSDWREENVTDFPKCCADFARYRSHVLSSSDSVTSSSIKILVTGASADRRYITLLHDIAHGKMLGSDTNVILVCYGNKKSTPMLQDMVNELKDCILPLLKEVMVSSDEKEAFSGIQIAILLDSQNNERLTTVDKYFETLKIFKDYGQSFNYSGSNVKVLVASEPANLNAQILRRNCTAVQPGNIAALSLIVINITKYQVAKKMDAQPDKIKNIIVWGDEPAKLAYDLNHSLIKVGDAWKHLPSVMANDHWIKNYLPELVKQRVNRTAGDDCTNFIMRSKAICEQLRYWWHGVQDGEIVRMGVESDGSYGVTKGLFADFPVTISSTGIYSIISDLEISPTAQIKLQALNEKLLMDIQIIQNWPMFQQNQLLI